MKYGYIRPMELYDDIKNQKLKIKKYTEHTYIEDHAESKRRHQLDQLIDKTVKENDQIIVTDICILADSTKQLVDIINACSKKSVRLYFINPDITVSADTEYNFQQILNEISNFQSDVVRFRTQQGMNKAAKEGKKMGRPKRSDDNIKRAVEMYMTKKYTLEEIREQTNISRATLYRHLEK